MKLSDLQPGDVAVFVRADGSESEPFLVAGEVVKGRNVLVQFARNRSPAPYGYELKHSVRKLGTGRLIPARIEMDTPEAAK